MPDEWDVVSPLSFVIDKLELCAVVNGARRSCVLPSTDELVKVRSGLELDVVIVPTADRSTYRLKPASGDEALNLSVAFEAIVLFLLSTNDRIDAMSVRAIISPFKQLIR